jgi:hypothetical protein
MRHPGQATSYGNLQSATMTLQAEILIAGQSETSFADWILRGISDLPFTSEMHFLF